MPSHWNKSRIAGSAVLLALLVSGLALSWRAVHGPFYFLTSVRSPLNAQSIFGLAFVLLLLLKSSTQSAFAAGAIDRQGRRNTWLAAVLLATGACFWTAMRIPFLCDEFVLIRHGQSFVPAAFKYLFTHGGGDGFFRPLGYLSLALDAKWADNAPALWHIPGFLLHLANCLLVYLLAESLYPGRGIAPWAAALFGIHGSRPESVTYMAARFDLLATFFVLAGLLLFLRYLDRRSLGILWCSYGVLVLGLLSKESAYAFPLLAALAAASTGSLSRRTVKALAPFFLLTMAVFAYRWHLLGGIGGYKDAATGRPQIWSLTPVKLFKGLALRMWSLLCFPINWGAEPEPYLAAALVLGIAALVLLARVRCHRSELAFALGFVLISAIPVAHLLLIGADIISSPHLYLASVGFSFLLGGALSSIGSMRRRALPGIALLLFQMAALFHNLSAWRRTAWVAQQTCAQAAEQVMHAAGAVVVSGLPQTVGGVPFFANGFPECVELRSPGKGAYVRLARPQDAPLGSPAAILVWDSVRQGLLPVSLAKPRGAGKGGIV